MQLPKDSGQPGCEPGLASAGRVERTAGDVPADEHAIFAVNQRRSDAQRLGRAMTLQLVPAIDAQNE